jgi:hypothetical protein
VALERIAPAAHAAVRNAVLGTSTTVS